MSEAKNILNAHIETKSPFFRKGTAIKPKPIAFCYNFGGVGDFIHWTTAIKYAIENIDYIYGYVAAPKFFVELARLWLGKYPGFEVIECNDITVDRRLAGIVKKTPNIHDNVDALGSNLLELGFRYYLNMDTVPKGYEKPPRIEGNEADLTKFSLPEKYVVITTNSTVKVREMPVGTINSIKDHLLQKGITPVYLGKAELLGSYKSESNDAISTARVIDLREKTTLTEAACILAKAQLVVGVDNGLLHLACCSDVPVIMGFTTVDPRHRVTERYNNAKTYVVTPPEELSCRFCQSNIRHFIGHDYRQCIYKDNLCVKTMSPEIFISAIDQVLAEK